MNDFTYGNSPAAIQLAKTITEKYPRWSKKVGKYTGEANRAMFLLASSHRNFKYDMGMLESILRLQRNFYIDRIKNSKIPIELQSFMLNIITKSYRLWLRVILDYKTMYINEFNDTCKSQKNKTL